jgi:hypothetical protein
VGVLVVVVDIGLRGVSGALAILEEGVLVVVGPVGRRRIYSLRPQPFRELSEFVTAYRAIWEPRLDRLGAELERRRQSKDKKEKKR